MRFAMLWFLRLSTLMAVGASAIAAEQEIIEEKKSEKKEETEIVVNFEDSEGDGEEQFDSGFGNLFNNPALASGLSSGSALINRSIESLMEIVFYRLLDQEIRTPITDELQFKVGVSRDVYPTVAGAFVVMDRFYLGPDFARELTRVKGVPISLGVDGRVSIYDIYLRTDGMRLAEQEELPFWRSSLNNMFGALPLLSSFLPPSFNPNELYDPGRLLETSASFPLTIGGLRSMPVGAIRSYNISGGVNLPIEFAARLTKDIRDDLARAEGVKATLPYTIFVEGEFRINVLRRSQNIAWVGLTRVKRFGNRFTAGVGKAIALLDKLILAKWWSGVPARLFPLDAQWVKAKANIFNQLYEFDLRRAESRRAYEHAVKGDFSLAMEMHLKQKKLEENTGVSFQFTRVEDAIESLSETATNLILLSSELENSRAESEIEITDDQGKFYLLRSKAEANDDFTEALTGRQREIYQNLVEMKVVRAPDPDYPNDADHFIYKFDREAENPIQLTISFRIQDRYVDAHEYRNYIEKIRYFTALPLTSVPKIPRRDARLIEERVRNITLKNPTQDHMFTHVTPTYLGRFDSTAAMFFSSEVLDEVLARSEDEKWAAFAKAFGFNRLDWKQKQSRESFFNRLNWLGYVGMRPFSLFNIRSATLDFIAEANAAINALEEIQDSDTPLEKLSAFDELFKASYPDKLAHALFLLSDRKSVPRSVTLNTKARGAADKETKRAFDFLRNKVYRSVINFPPKERSRLADEKLNAFYPDEMRERRVRPIIKKIDVRMGSIPLGTMRNLMNEQASQAGWQAAQKIKAEQILVRIYAKNVSPAMSGRLYLRCEETGKIQLGKFVIGEKVFEVKPKILDANDPDAKLGVLVYEFFLTGPLSPLKASFFETSVDAGGEFQVDVSLSNDGKLWSDERNFRFVYARGKLAPPP